jgi:uncharacterized membrane protein
VVVCGVVCGMVCGVVCGVVTVKANIIISGGKLRTFSFRLLEYDFFFA